MLRVVVGEAAEPVVRLARVRVRVRARARVGVRVRVRVRVRGGGSGFGVRCSGCGCGVVTRLPPPVDRGRRLAAAHAPLGWQAPLGRERGVVGDEHRARLD